MSLKVNNLRVGNYLLKDGVTVTIDARSIFDIWSDENLNKEYKPIPLTEEWLKRLSANLKFNPSFILNTFENT